MLAVLDAVVLPSIGSAIDERGELSPDPLSLLDDDKEEKEE